MSTISRLDRTIRTDWYRYPDIRIDGISISSKECPVKLAEDLKNKMVSVFKPIEQLGILGTVLFVQIRGSANPHHAFVATNTPDNHPQIVETLQSARVTHNRVPLSFSLANQLPSRAKVIPDDAQFRIHLPPPPAQVTRFFTPQPTLARACQFGDDYVPLNSSHARSSSMKREASTYTMQSPKRTQSPLETRLENLETRVREVENNQARLNELVQRPLLASIRQYLDDDEITASQTERNIGLAFERQRTTRDYDYYN